MYNIVRTSSDSIHFQELVKELDSDLAIRDVADHLFYAQFNKIATIKYVVVVYNQKIPVGCGAVKEYDSVTMEVKRMFVPIHKRGQGIASIILNELEKWAFELGYAKCILETGYKQPEAIRLYQKNNYVVIPNYGQYAGMENSVCFEKLLKK